MLAKDLFNENYKTLKKKQKRSSKDGNISHAYRSESIL
jgi:hypothetical protein